MDFLLLINIINVIAIIFSPIFAYLISYYLHNRHEKRQEKVRILGTLMVGRMASHLEEYAEALNMIDVVFVDSEKVKQAYQELYEAYGESNCEKSKNYFKKLIEAIVEDVGYKGKITWEAIDRVYYPDGLSEKDKREKYIQNLQLAVSAKQLENSENNVPQPERRERR